MNQIKDILVVFLTLAYHLAMVAGAAYLVYYKDASAWLFLVPMFMSITFRTKDSK